MSIYEYLMMVEELGSLNMCVNVSYMAFVVFLLYGVTGQIGSQAGKNEPILLYGFWHEPFFYNFTDKQRSEVYY